MKLKAISLAALLVSSLAHSAPLQLSDGYLKFGLNDFGTLGSGGKTPPGLLYDPTGKGNYLNNDFLTPGTPYEAFYLRTAAGSYASQADNAEGGSFISSGPTRLSATSASWTGKDNNLQVTHVYRLQTVGGHTAINIDTTLTNIGSVDLIDLQFLRTIDPDPDMNNYGSYSTTNQVVESNQACATGGATKQTLCLRGQGQSGVAGVSNWSTDPAVFLSGINVGDGDNTLGLAFALGNLGIHQSTTLRYSYGMGASFDDAKDLPEPGSAALALLTLGMLGLARKRRSA